VPVILAARKKKGENAGKKIDVYMLTGEKEREKEIDSPRELDSGVFGRSKC